MRRILLAVAVCGLALTSMTVAAGTAGRPTPAGAAVPTPRAPTLTEVTPGSGTHGFPYDAAPQSPAIPQAPSVPLAAMGYAEQEYTMSGVTNTYNESGLWLSNGQWGISAASTNVPYTTRLLVRYPTDPAKFNGTVIVEWLNDTTGGDQDPVWSEIYNEVVDNGYAYVGVTAQTAGMADLKTWDPVRYASLGDSNDGQSYDIFTQAAQAARADTSGLLGSDVPTRIIGMGDSQSAFRVDTYVNAIQPVFHAYNGFIAVGRAGVDAPLGTGLLNFSPAPALVRTDNTAPFIQLNTQGDVTELDAALARQPDNNDLRTWEVSGASHIDNHEATYELETFVLEQPTIPLVECSLGTPVEGTGTPLDGTNQADNMPLYEVEDAAVADLQNWLANGVPAPKEGSPLSTSSVAGLWYLPNTNSYGVASGGVQLPEAAVPTEDYGTINLPSSSATNGQTTTQSIDNFIALFLQGNIPVTNNAGRTTGLCLLAGYYTALSTSTLQQLYPSHAAYVFDYAIAVYLDEQAGFLTQADGSAALAAAEASSVP